MTQLDQRAIAHFRYDEIGSVRFNAYKSLASFTLSLRQISKKLSIGVSALSPQIGFDLKDCSAKQRINTTTDLWDLTFEVDFADFGAQTIRE
jgi:hypothetical protein